MNATIDFSAVEWIDVSDVQSLPVDVLDAMHREALRRVQTAAHNRSGIRYRDAKMARDVLAAERRRRAFERRTAVTASRTVDPAAHSHDCVSSACWYATTPASECSHGPCPEHGTRRVTAVPAPRRDPFAGLPTADDAELGSWGITASVSPRRDIFDFEGAM